MKGGKKNNNEYNQLKQNKTNKTLAKEAKERQKNKTKKYHKKQAKKDFMKKDQTTLCLPFQTTMHRILSSIRLKANDEKQPMTV